MLKRFEDGASADKTRGGKKFWVIPIKDRRKNPLRIWADRGRAKPKGILSTDPPIRYSIERLVWGRQSDYKDKVAVIQDLRFEDGRKELRFGYYMISSENNPKRKGEWTWGQSPLMIPKPDIKELLSLAARNGMLTLNPS